MDWNRFMKTIAALALVLALGCRAQTNLITPVTVLPKADRSATGVLQFRDAQASPHTLGFRSPMTASNTLWTLPDSDAVGCLTSDGAGNLSWGSCGSSGPFVMTTNTSQTVTGVKTLQANLLSDGSHDLATSLVPFNAGYFNNLTGQNVTVTNLTVTNTCTGCTGGLPTNIMTLNTAQTVTATKTWQADQIGSGSPNFGSNTQPFGAGWFLNSVATRLLFLNDSSGTLTSPAYSIVADANFLTKRLQLKDDAGVSMLTMWRVSGGTTLSQARMDMEFDPTFDNLYSLGVPGISWKSLSLGTSLLMGGFTVLDASRNMTVNNLTVNGTCTGCGGGGGAFLPLIGGTMTGSINVNVDNSYTLGTLTNAWNTMTSHSVISEFLSVALPGTLFTPRWTMRLLNSGGLSVNNEFQILDDASQVAVTVGRKLGGVPFKWLTLDGHLYPGADGVYDLGSTGASRWRSLTLAGDGTAALYVMPTGFTPITVINSVGSYTGPSVSASGPVSGTSFGIVGVGGGMTGNACFSSPFTWSGVGGGSWSCLRINGGIVVGLL